MSKLANAVSRAKHYQNKLGSSSLFPAGEGGVSLVAVDAVGCFALEPREFLMFAGVSRSGQDVVLEIGLFMTRSSAGLNRQ